MGSSYVDRLEELKLEFGVKELFDDALAILDCGLHGLRRWTYPIGVWFGVPSGRRRPALIGLDVCRRRPAAVAILVFERALAQIDAAQCSALAGSLNAEPAGDYHPGVSHLIAISDCDQLDRHRDEIAAFAALVAESV